GELHGADVELRQVARPETVQRRTASGVVEAEEAQGSVGTGGQPLKPGTGDHFRLAEATTLATGTIVSCTRDDLRREPAPSLLFALTSIDQCTRERNSAVSLLGGDGCAAMGPDTRGLPSRRPGVELPRSVRHSLVALVALLILVVVAIVAVPSLRHGVA